MVVQFSKGQTSPVPMTLISFTAKYEDPVVILRWETQAEIDNEYFTVQRSADGLIFEDICTTSGAGNSTEQKYYSDEDRNPLYGTSFYRLMQTDINGQKTTSTIVPIRIKQKNPINLKLYSNPGNSLLQFEASFSHAGRATVTVLDASGKTVLKSEFSVTREPQLYSMNKDGLKSGIYHLILLFDDNAVEQLFFY